MLGKIIAAIVIAVIVGVLYYHWGYLPYQKVGTLKIETTGTYLRSGYTMCMVKVLEASGDTDGIRAGDEIGYPRSLFYYCMPKEGIVETYVWANGEILTRK